MNDIGSILQTQQGVLRVDLVGTPMEEARPILEDLFGFHPLAVADAVEETHVPKVDDWDEYLSIVLHTAAPETSEGSAIQLLELDCFLMPHCLVTYQLHRASTVDHCWDTVRSDPQLVELGAPHLLYRLLDMAMTDFARALDILGEQEEVVEDQLFARPTEALLGAIFALRRELLKVRRSFGLQREVLTKLSRDDFAVLDKTSSLYFRDIYDHLVRLHDITDAMREMASSALEMYLSVVNNRMNGVMKTLTVITTLFMPLTFLAGFFGMNLFQPSVSMPMWTGTVSLGLTIGAMLVLPVLMFWLMRRRGLS